MYGEKDGVVAKNLKAKKGGDVVALWWCYVFKIWWCYVVEVWWLDD